MAGVRPESLTIGGRDFGRKPLGWWGRIRAEWRVWGNDHLEVTRREIGAFYGEEAAAVFSQSANPTSTTRELQTLRQVGGTFFPTPGQQRSAHVLREIRAQLQGDSR